MDMNGSLELMFTLGSYESSCAKSRVTIIFLEFYLIPIWLEMEF